MTLGAVILLGLVAGEVVAFVKVGRQNERIKRLEAKADAEEKEPAKSK